MPTTVKKIGNVEVETGHGSFVEQAFVDAPFTSIENRAQVSNSLKPIMGNERIIINSLNRLTSEFGPNGEPVWETDKQDPRIRFAGPNWVAFYDSAGQYVRCGQSLGTSFMEVTFYGTGLNLMFAKINVGTSYTLATELDGASIGNTTADQSTVNPLRNTNYKANGTTNVVNGLPLDWHTVKIFNEAGRQVPIIGVEIVNEASQITVPAGTCYSEGQKVEVATSLIDYNLGFENVADLDVGSNGGRVIIAADSEDGQVKKWLNKTESTPAYLANTDHSNETAYRSIYYHEFGRARVNDFHSLGASVSDRYFTMDDGTTGLIGDNVYINNGRLRINGTGQYTITFVGTGLDVVAGNPNPQSTTEITVDGVVVGSLDSLANDQLAKLKICSGLPYGTHTVKFRQAGASQPGFRVDDFIVYKPKKPSLPAGVIELGDYCLMADYAVTTAGIENVSSGVLRKDSTREANYVGADWNGEFNIANGYIGGVQYYTLQAGQYFEYTFTGTGFEVRHRAFPTYSSDISVEINGTALTAANFPTATFNQYGYDAAYDQVTGTLDMRSAADNRGAGFGVSNLPMGTYTVRMTTNLAATTFSVEAFDIITPIHHANTTVGSMAIRDTRNLDPDKVKGKKLEKDKLFAEFNFSSSQFIRSSKNISQIMNISTSHYLIFFEDVNADRENYVHAFGGTTGNQEHINLLSYNGYNPVQKNYITAFTFNSVSGAQSPRGYNIGKVFGSTEEEAVDKSEE